VIPDANDESLPVFVVGLSLGGCVAVRALQDAPEVYNGGGRCVGMHVCMYAYMDLSVGVEEEVCLRSNRCTTVLLFASHSAAIRCDITEVTYVSIDLRWLIYRRSNPACPMNKH
jgi:pimeloyl-ACP methyl ester carboxylesterase